nr:Chain D, hnRNP F [synthetic construct]3TFY_E Chain E, hnRNP F [synthetic construct]3TFY_F Chain F, hnRNP F [synthetic construct]
MLGPEGGRWG